MGQGNGQEDVARENSSDQASLSGNSAQKPAASRPSAGQLTAAELAKNGDESAGAAEVAARLRLVVMRLSRRLRQQTGADMSPSLMSALASVERHGPLTLGRLAAIERVQPPSVTRLVARLEQGGLVVRHADADDRRFARVALTPLGRRVLQRSRTRKTAYLAHRLRGLSEEELGVLRDAVAVLEHLVEDEPCEEER